MKKNIRVEAVKEALRNPHTFPGAYPKTFVSYDGCLCHKCVRSSFRAVVNDTRDNRGAWNLCVDVVWEGEAWCVDCGSEIETAYGSDEGFEDPTTTISVQQQENTGNTRCTQ